LYIFRISIKIVQEFGDVIGILNIEVKKYQIIEVLILRKRCISQDLHLEVINHLFAQSHYYSGATIYIFINKYVYK